MGGVGPLDLAARVQAVALILDAQPVKVIGLSGRRTYFHESVSAAVTVSVHLGSAEDVDLVGDVLDLVGGAVAVGRDLYSREGDWQAGVFVSLYGPAHQGASLSGLAS